MKTKSKYNKERYRARALALAVRGLTVRGTPRKKRVFVSCFDRRADNLRKWNKRVEQLDKLNLTTRGTPRRIKYLWHGQRLTFAILKRKALEQADNAKREATAMAARLLEQFKQAA